MAESAGAAYGSMIAEQLGEERARKASFEQRGLSVIATSGTLVTLLFALAGLITAVEDFSLSGGALGFLVAALILFVIASALGIATNWPLNYSEPTVDSLRELVTPERFAAEAAMGERVSANTRLDTLKEARRMNGYKVKLLVAAMIAQVLAVLSLAIAVALVLSTG